jgi:hypothetical protein
MESEMIEMTTQTLTLTLDGITAGDYLTWIRDPEPPALGRELREIEVSADPLGETISATLRWEGTAPPARVAAAVAGLPPTAEVTGLTSAGHRRTEPQPHSRVRSAGLIRRAHPAGAGHAVPA